MYMYMYVEFSVIFSEPNGGITENCVAILDIGINGLNDLQCISDVYDLYALCETEGSYTCTFF